MDENHSEFVDKTVLNTPKPTACSTVDRSLHKRKQYHFKQLSSADLENSLGLLPFNQADTSSGQNENGMSDVSHQLQQQRLLANSSLQRANKVASIPSRYLRPNNINTSSVSNLNLTADSTVSESDLLKTPKDTSTPRTSIMSNSFADNKSRLSLGQSMAQLSYKIGNTDISIDNFVKEFQSAMKNLDKEGNPEGQSNVFRPAEEATSMLLADEMSWRRQNDIPISENFAQNTSTDVSVGKVSVGAFFQQRSDTLSDFQAAVSPEKERTPVPLIDSSTSFSQEIEQNKNQAKTNNSLSISAIQKFLAQTEDTPRKVTNYLFSQGNKLDDKENYHNSLPVSKNSSYTSNYSENDAMKCIVADKENIQCNEQLIVPGPIETSTRSENRASSTAPTQTSSRSSSALTSLPNGKLPIESTKAELIWGCVKVDRCVTQEFLLRNRTPKRLCLQMSVSGHEFKIRKDSRQDSDPLTAAKIMLHPHESRPVIVSFIPTKIGAAMDELVFTSLDPNLQQTKKQCVRLFGYGGYGKLDFYNLTKDTTGKFWLSLGEVGRTKYHYENFLPRTFSHLQTSPCLPIFFVLIPNEEKEILITYIPTADDHKSSQQSFFSNALVADIGTLLVVSGTEVNRGRLRRLCRKCVERGLTVEPVSNILKETIKNEIMPADLLVLKENPGAIKEILKFFTRNEIVLTLEQDPEQTIMPQFPDESAMFHSICQDNTIVSLERTQLESSCKLEPSVIILTPPTKMRDTLFLISRLTKFYISKLPVIPRVWSWCLQAGQYGPARK
ncbi:hypothetical protein NQ318_018659 [Aromia moschata]|uniref:Cep192/Spd-2-like domain-containing protein n=1 Tax=Aromia moschata TaxID=1265417 RepID=A0AAV8ZG59_9CUCU|nr:hypothetical protein NQ318_018659 [Aromia moschata]